jgi:uroporphyrin-III C-methyltransferase
MADTTSNAHNTAATPIVYLVGAGPGDPDYLTMKAHRLINQADVIVYDRLVSQEIMDLVPDGIARINVGKQPGCHCVPQNEINDLLLSLAKENRCVVRLKGGDPFLFGRGGEEAVHLRNNGVDFETVPGVTSASGCAADIGLPLTHRGIASSVRYVTGHMRDGNELDQELDWDGLADTNTTLVIYMGISNIPKIAAKLIERGLPASTGAAAICNATRPDQQQVISTLRDLAHDTIEAKLDGPVLFIIGNVISLLEITGKDIQLTQNQEDQSLSINVA